MIKPLLSLIATYTSLLFSMSFLAVFGLLISCKTNDSKLQITDKEHEQEMDEWEDMRREALLAEDGWLNLIGLYWLDSGGNGMGADAPVSLPPEKYPRDLGEFEWFENKVTFNAKVDGVFINGKEVKGKELVFDLEHAITPILEFQSLRWQVIKRGDRVGVRLRDLDSEAVRSFIGVDRFPRDISWRKVGRFTPYEPHKQIPLANVLGQTIPTAAVGTVSFEVAGRIFQLDVFEEGEELFLIFADESSGRSTYGGGRYLYAERPDSDGRVILDFNKSINPPCVFTAYATCPLPPNQNILGVTIESGELATYQTNQK